MTAVTDVLVDTHREPLKLARVVVRLVTGGKLGAFLADGDTSGAFHVVQSTSVRTDDTGRWTADLAPLDTVEPEGAFYTFEVPGYLDDPIAFVVPTAPADGLALNVRDLLVAGPINGGQVVQGADGEPGPPGDPGADGADGVGVLSRDDTVVDASTDITPGGRLMLTPTGRVFITDGETQDKHLPQLAKQDEVSTAAATSADALDEHVLADDPHHDRADAALLYGFASSLVGQSPDSWHVSPLVAGVANNVPVLRSVYWSISYSRKGTTIDQLDLYVQALAAGALYRVGLYLFDAGVDPLKIGSVATKALDLGTVFDLSTTLRKTFALDGASGRPSPFVVPAGRGFAVAASNEAVQCAALKTGVGGNLAPWGRFAGTTGTTQGAVYVGGVQTRTADGPLPDTLSIPGPAKLATFTHGVGAHIAAAS